LAFTVPAGVAGPATVEVIRSGYTTGTSTVDFEYIAQPEVLEVAPSEGPISGGGAVQVLGYGFTPIGTTTVKFGAVTADTFNVFPDGTIAYGTVPAAAASGPVFVTARNDGGNPSNGAPYF